MTRVRPSRALPRPHPSHEAGQATTALVTAVAVFLIGFIWLYQLRVVSAEDQRSGLQQAADAAALAGAQKIATDLPSVLLAEIRHHSGGPTCGLGRDAAANYAGRNHATLISYCYYPSTDRVKVTIRSQQVLESGRQEEAVAVASISKRVTACDLIGTPPSPSPTPSAGDEEAPPAPIKLKYRCGQLVIPVKVVGDTISFSEPEADVLKSFHLKPQLVS